MSDSIEQNTSRSCGNASRGGKPSHVKCLNFGQSILEFDTADQLGCFAMSSCRRRKMKQKARISPTKDYGKDYVRKWVEFHSNEKFYLSDDLSPSSPILRTSMTCESSPVLGNSGKQYRKGTRVNRHVVKSVSDIDDQKQNAQYPANCTTQLDSRSKGESQNEEEYLHKVQCTPPGAEMITEESPVLGTRSYSYKRRRRKLFETEDQILPKRLKFDDDKVTNTHIELDNNDDTLHEKSIDRIELQEDSSSSVKETNFQIETEKSPKELPSCTTRISLSQTSQRLSFEDSSSHNNNEVNSKIEIDTSDESDKGEHNKVSSTNSSNTSNSLSNIVEEVESQDMLPIIKTTHLLTKSLFTSRSGSKASNETYCSEAEILQNQSTHLSAKISLVPSLTREVTESKLTETPVISTISTPSKVSPDETTYARLLDSGKKPHKAKKGSMVAKLQSLINTQISGIRIWRHRMKKNDETVSAQYISVLVRECSKQFGNQFLKGSLIEDRFNLLKSNIEIGEAESCNVQTPTRKTSRRDLTIILVCDIVGTLKMMSQVVINVYPPWEVLDKIDLTLEAMYISINHEMSNLSPDKDNSRKREKLIVKEFNCPCIEERRELPFCARKPSADKPDVMQQIFDF